MPTQYAVEMRTWMVRAGRRGQDEQVALEQQLAIVGFYEVPDLSGATSRDAVAAVCRKAFPVAPEARVEHFARQLHTFANEISIGDIVALPLKTAQKVMLGVVKGPYEYRSDLGQVHHTRKVEWVRAIPRTDIGQDLRYSLGAFMTVCRIQRNDADARFAALLNGEGDPGAAVTAQSAVSDTLKGDQVDVEQLARDQIIAHIRLRFSGHELARLVDAVMQAEGYVTELSPPGPDGGVDILAAKGALGFDPPYLCVQVKSSSSPVDVNVLRSLQGTMSTFKAQQGLLVSWGGFTGPVEKEARLSFFSVRLWDAGALLEAVFRTYEQLPAELQTDLPLKRFWGLVLEERDSD